MLSKIGLMVGLAAGLAVTVLTTALYATPLVVVELSRMHQPKAPLKASLTPDRTDEQMCSRINETTPGSCIPNADLGDGLANDKGNKTTSTVAVHDVTIDFPGWMSDENIHKAIQKNLPPGAKYDIAQKLFLAEPRSSGVPKNGRIFRIAKCIRLM
jgi:hypothetical protein